MALAVFACTVLAVHGVADAGGRKRVVVLDFEGPKSERFHDDLVKLIKKTHTVVPTDKWNGAAEQLDAGTLSEKNVKKVAKKLKVDAIVEGKIEKRRDEFIIRIKLRAGKSGEQVGDTIDTKAEGPRIDGRAQRDLKDELVGAIDSVESNHLGGAADDEEEDAPKKTARKPSKADDDEDEDAPKKTAAKKPAKASKAEADADDEDDRPARRSGFSRKLDDERGADRTDKRTRKTDDEDDRPGKKPAAKKPGKSEARDDEDELPAKKTAAAKKAERADDEDRLPPKKTAAAKKAEKADDEDKLPPKKTVAAKKSEDEDKLPPKKPVVAKPADDDADRLPPRKPAARNPDDEPRKATRKVASRDDDDAGAETESDRGPLDAAAARSPGERALDAVVGLSVTMRRMSFAVSPTLRATPPGYKGTPVAGGLVDVTFYPLAMAHTRSDQMKNIGVELLYDRVIKLNSQDPQTKMTYSTIESRFALNGVYRYPLGSSPTAPVLVGTLGFLRQSFNILGPVDIPDVKYSMVPLGAGIRYPLGGKLTLGADLKALFVLGTGQISDPNQYGSASVIGFEGAAGADYLITPNIFARAAVRIETIGFTFDGGAFQTNQRDGDAMTQDVKSGRDTYFGGLATVGYIF